MSEQGGANPEGRKRRSFTDAVAMFVPIVPLPGDAPRASVTAVPDAPDDDLPPFVGPQPVPLPPHRRAPALPGTASLAPAQVVPDGPADLLPAQGPNPIAIPPHPLAPTPRPSQAVAELEAETEQTAKIPTGPKPMDDAEFRRSITPPSLADVPGEAVAAASSRMRPRLRWAWVWRVLLMLSAVGATTLWVQRASEPQAIGPTAELAMPAPAGVAPSPEATPAPSSSAEPATGPTFSSSFSTLSEPALGPVVEQPPVGSTAERAAPSPAGDASPLGAAPTLAPPADLEADPTLPAVPQAGPEPAPGPPPTALLPMPDTEPATADAQPALPMPPLPVPPLPIPPVPASALPDRRVVIYRRPASSAAEAEAARVAAKLQPLAAQVETRTAAAISRLPTVRYFHAEDAAAAQELSAALRRPGAEWRVQGMLGQAPLPPRSFQVWLPDR